VIESIDFYFLFFDRERERDDIVDNLNTFSNVCLYDIHTIYIYMYMY
jgi:hypothetical protein